MRFGERLRALREEQRLSQQQLGQRTRLQQAKISRLESGEMLATIGVIDRLAVALGRTGRELVRGTDREGYYLVGTLTAEEAQQEQERILREESIARGLPVLALRVMYQRIYDVFEAIYGGRYVAPVVHGEGLYLEMVENCRKALVGVEELCPGFSEQIYFPDHIEPQYELDLVLDAWQTFEKAEVKRSQRLILEQELRFCRAIDPSLETAFVHLLQLEHVDKMVDRLRTQRIEAEDDWINTNLSPR